MYWFEGGSTTHRFALYRESAGQWDPWPPVGMSGMTINPGEDWMIEERHCGRPAVDESLAGW